MKRILFVILIVVLSLVACGAPAPIADTISASPNPGDYVEGEKVRDVVESAPVSDWKDVPSALESYQVGDWAMEIELLLSNDTIEISYVRPDGSDYGHFFVETSKAKPEGYWYVGGDDTYDFRSNPDWIVRLGMAQNHTYLRLNNGTWQFGFAE